MLHSILISDVRITDSFFAGRIKQIIDETLPYMWECLNDRVEDVPKSHCIENFKIAAGISSGSFEGYPFQDAGMYKWMQSASFALQIAPNPKLEEIIEYCIDLMEKVQLPDGYINCYYIINGMEKRWTDVRRAHELCVAGYVMETAVAYYQATGKTRLLRIAEKLADHIDSVFGPEEGKLKGYPGHQEVEIGLVKLFEITGERKYLLLAKFFLDERGKKPYYYDIEAEKRGEGGVDSYYDCHGPERYSYMQAHKPVREQVKAIGHAVRAGYMYTSMAEVGALTEDQTLIDAAKVLWDDLVNRQMYITGGIGSMCDGEALTFDYDLPNDIMYAETCAGIALMKFAQRMQRIERKSEYADIVELALYNAVLGGIQLDNKKFFYVNPMEMWPERSAKRHDMREIIPERKGWYGCACCPPNVVRTLIGLSEYIYSVDVNTIFVNLFVGSEAFASIGGKKVKIIQDGGYPWSGRLSYSFELTGSAYFSVAIRMPGWAKNAELKVNGVRQDVRRLLIKGYIVIEKNFSASDRIELELPMRPVVLHCNSNVPFNAGKAVVKRGPLIYCLEECDNGKRLWNLYLKKGSVISEQYERGMLGGIIALTAGGERRDSQTEALYFEDETEKTQTDLKMIPYYAWCNREPGEMTVWIHETE